MASEDENGLGSLGDVESEIPAWINTLMFRPTLPCCDPKGREVG